MQEMQLHTLGFWREKFKQIWAKVILLQLKLTKLKPEIRKSDFQRKKERHEHR